jgi:hypothetical protein
MLLVFDKTLMQRPLQANTKKIILIGGYFVGRT